jgi:REP element-mobilizing transposase RayT
MPRKTRLFVPGATYHVYCRVARGEDVFSDSREAQGFVQTLRDVKRRDGFLILAWCLMSNHYHLVLQTASVPLWRSMARLQGIVARSYNRRHDYRGRLWQARYKARIIDSNQYFQQVVAYVHLNPVAAGLVEDPSDYELSGHRDVIGVANPGLVDVTNLLAASGQAQRDEALKVYLSWIRNAAEVRWLRKGITDLPWWSAATHADEILDPGQHIDAETFDRCKVDDARPVLDLQEIAARFERSTSLRIEDLASRRRDPTLSAGRVDLTAIAAGRFGHRVCEIARLINKNPGSVSRWLKAADTRSVDDSAYRRRLDELDRAISSAADSERHKVIRGT